MAYRAPAPFAIVDAVPEFIWRMSAEGRHRCTEDKDIIIKVGTNERKFTRYGLLQNFTLPNFYFHRTTSYDIAALRDRTRQARFHGHAGQSLTVRREVGMADPPRLTLPLTNNFSCCAGGKRPGPTA